MKKILLFLITLSVIILAAIFTISHTTSAEDQLLNANVEALADDPVCWWLDGEGLPGTCICPNGSGDPYLPTSHGVCKKDTETGIKKCGSKEEIRSGYSIVAFCSSEC